MKPFPFYKQETSWTCGAAAMRMVLEKIGIKKSEKQVIQILKTNKVRGTWHKDFPKVAEKYKLDYIVNRNASIQKLKKYQKEGYEIIICYSPTPKSDHYAVLKKLTSKFIFFYDPWFGEEHKMELDHFLKKWKSDPKYEKEKQWFFAIKKNKDF